MHDKLMELRPGFYKDYIQEIRDGKPIAGLELVEDSSVVVR